MSYGACKENREYLRCVREWIKKTSPSDVSHIIVLVGFSSLEQEIFDRCVIGDENMEDVSCTLENWPRKKLCSYSTINYYKRKILTKVAKLIERLNFKVYETTQQEAKVDSATHEKPLDQEQTDPAQPSIRKPLIDFHRYG
jgi:hypothetical protein